MISVAVSSSVAVWQCSVVLTASFTSLADELLVCTI